MPKSQGRPDPGDAPSATDPESFVTDQWIEAVFKTPDTPLRTHRITLSYSKFAAYLDESLFGGASVPVRTYQSQAIRVGNANWFNFATWGTYTLGPNIRNDGAPQRLETLPDSIRRKVAPAIVQSRSADGELVGRALAWGQELIFLSAARALLCFKRMDQTQLDKPFRTSSSERANLLKALNWSGYQWIDDGHLDLVDDAFECYRLVRRRVKHLQKSTNDPDAIQSDAFVAKLLLFATYLLTAAEQSVVDKALAVVVDSVPARFFKGIEGRISRLAHWRRDVPEQVAAYGLLARLNETEGAVKEIWARLMTSYLLVIVLPTEILRLGRDVPLQSPTSSMFPVPLMDLTVSPTTCSDYMPDSDTGSVEEKLTSLMDFVNALDRSERGAGSAARDWRRFDDRMNWAISLFRSRQQDSTLYWSPYSIEDTNRIIDGILPRASGHPGQGSVMPPLDPVSIESFLKKARVVGP